MAADQQLYVGRALALSIESRYPLYMARVLHWNGKDLPKELRELPAGDYLVEELDGQAPELTPEEEAGIETALESHRQGRGVDADRARAIVDAALRR